MITRVGIVISFQCTVQAKSFRPDDEDDYDSDDDYSDDEEMQSPLDDVDPFIYFVDTIKGMWSFFKFDLICSKLSDNI